VRLSNFSKMRRTNTRPLGFSVNSHLSYTPVIPRKVAMNDVYVLLGEYIIGVFC